MKNEKKEYTEKNASWTRPSVVRIPLREVTEHRRWNGGKDKNS